MAEIEMKDIYKMRARAEVDELGLRERHKIDKFERICSAALQLFSRGGYDRTTLREIAAEAGVALGTLSLYARDKRDLIFLIFNKVMPPLLEQGRRNVEPKKLLVDNMVAFFEPIYLAFSRNITLYRVLLGQIYNGPPTVHVKENNAMRARLAEHIVAIILHAQRSGECSAEGDVNLLADSFYYLHFAWVRIWLSKDKPKVEEGLSKLRALFEQHVKGMRNPGKNKKG